MRLTSPHRRSRRASLVDSPRASRTRSRHDAPVLERLPQPLMRASPYSAAIAAGLAETIATRWGARTVGPVRIANHDASLSFRRAPRAGAFGASAEGGGPAGLHHPQDAPTHCAGVRYIAPGRVALPFFGASQSASDPGVDCRPRRAGPSGRGDGRGQRPTTMGRCVFEPTGESAHRQPLTLVCLANLNCPLGHHPWHYVVS